VKVNKDYAEKRGSRIPSRPVRGGKTPYGRRSHDKNPWTLPMKIGAVITVLIVNGLCLAGEFVILGPNGCP
jgi:hypothetical protein